MDVKRIRQFILNRKLYVIIIIIFATGFAAGFAASKAIQDPTNSLAIITTIVTISGSISGMWKLFSDYRKSTNVPSLEYGELTSDVVSAIERDGIRKQVTYFLEVRETRGLGEKVDDCEAFIDIPRAGVTHRQLIWINGDKQSISIGLREKLYLFTVSSLVSKDNSETDKHYLFLKTLKLYGSLGFDVPLDSEKVDINSEVIVTMQVGRGGNAPAKPYKTTIKQILESVSTA